MDATARANPAEITSGLPAAEHHSLYNVHLHQLQQLQGERPNGTVPLPGAPAHQPPPALPNPYAAQPDIHQSFVPAPGQTQPPAAEYHNAPPALPSHSAAASLPPQSYALDATSRQPGELFLLQPQDQHQPQFPYHSMNPGPPQKQQVNAPDMMSSLGRSQALAAQSKAPMYPAHSNQLFSQQHQYYPQIAPQPTDRIGASSAAPQNPQSRSLLHSSAPYLPPADTRYAQPTLPGQPTLPAQPNIHGQLAPPNYMLQQAQQLAGVPDEFSQGQMRSHDPRAAGMVGFPTPQFDMHRYPGAASQPANTLAAFNMPPNHPTSESHPPSDPNPLLASPAQPPRNDAIYRQPAVPKFSAPVDLPPPAAGATNNQTAFSKAPTLGSSPPNQQSNDNGGAASSLSRKNSAKIKPVPAIKKAPRLAVAGGAPASSSALTAAVASQVEGVPSTVVSDAVGGSAADIDNSLIERLRGFSHQQQQPLPPPTSAQHLPKQQLLLPQGANLPPTLFPSPLEQPSIATAPTLNHDPYRVPTIRRGQAGAPRDHAAALVSGMLPGQQCVQIPNAPQVPIQMGTSRRSRSGGSGVTTEATPERPFKCRYCNASFGRRDNMQKHERSIHMGERPFVCEICSYAFQKKDHKDKHVRTVHLKERPYQCTLCESRFGQKSDLTKHIRTVHQRIKPFKCEHCGLSFGHRGNKLRHVFVVHQKRKPHVCRICNQAFGERSNLAKHSLAVHKLALK